MIETGMSLEDVSAQRARRFVARCEPFVQAVAWKKKIVRISWLSLDFRVNLLWNFFLQVLQVRRGS